MQWSDLALNETLERLQEALAYVCPTKALNHPHNCHSSVRKRVRHITKAKGLQILQNIIAETELDSQCMCLPVCVCEEREREREMVVTQPKCLRTPEKQMVNRLELPCTYLPRQIAFIACKEQSILSTITCKHGVT